jgi:uncharacterized protein (TIRG00374 family)
MKRALGLIIGIAVSVFFFALSMKGTSVEELKSGFANANYLTLPLMLAMLFGFYWLKAMRWSWLLSPVKPVTTRQLFPPLLIGFAANNILPAHLGEFIRVFVVNRQHKIPATTVLSTVVLERIFDVVAILSLFGVGLMFTDTMPDEYRRNAIVLGGLCVVAVIGVTVYLIWTEWFLKVFGIMMSWVLPHRISEKILGMLRAGADGLASLKSGKMVALIALSSLAQWLLNGLMAYTALKAFHVPVTPLTGLIVTGVTAFGVTIPSTPGYFGVIQYCFTISMKAQGLDVNQSLVLAASLYYHISMYIPVTGLGLYYLSSLGLTIGDLTKAAVVDDEDDKTCDADASDFTAPNPATDSIALPDTKGT